MFLVGEVGGSGEESVKALCRKFPVFRDFEKLEAERGHGTNRIALANRELYWDTVLGGGGGESLRMSVEPGSHQLTSQTRQLAENQEITAVYEDVKRPSVWTFYR